MVVSFLQISNPGPSQHSNIPQFFSKHVHAKVPPHISLYRLWQQAPPIKLQLFEEQSDSDTIAQEQPG